MAEIERHRAGKEKETERKGANESQGKDSKKNKRRLIMVIILRGQQREIENKPLFYSTQ